MKFQYSTNYAEDINELNYILDNSEEIEFDEILEAIGEDEMEVLKARLGYSKVPYDIDTDWAVSFHKSELPDGRPVYYVFRSNIEYVYYEEME